MTEHTNTPDDTTDSKDPLAAFNDAVRAGAEDLRRARYYHSHSARLTAHVHPETITEICHETNHHLPIAGSAGRSIADSTTLDGLRIDQTPRVPKDIIVIITDARGVAVERLADHR